MILKSLVDIVKGCKRNERISQEKLYRQFYPGLFALCRKFFDDEQDIITALNNGMLNVYKNIDQYDSAKGELFTWAYTIVRNAALTHLRNNSNKPLNVEITGAIENAIGHNPFKELDWGGIYYFLGKLPPATRAVCTLFYIEGFMIKEIAAQMELSEGTVKWHLNEGRTILKKLLTKKDIY
ncbi:ECF RNA polymerase sigma factor SigM [compost metagenome]